MKLQDFKTMDKDDVLGLLGLESEHSGASRVLGHRWGRLASGCWLGLASPCCWRRSRQ